MVNCRCGLIGTGISTSLSPALHEVEGRRQGLDLSYSLFDVDTPVALKSTLDDAERDGFAGLNITHPFKQQVVELLDDLSPQARAIGAVNTVVFRDGKRVGHNTDAYGFTESFHAYLPDVAKKHVVQLGAGGAGAAVAHALLSIGVEKLSIIDPDEQKSHDLSQKIGQKPSDLTALHTADGLVNASPIGMHHHPGIPLPAELLHRDLWVADIVYMPVETELLRAARAAGSRTVGGTAMCAYQAAAAFHLFTGIAPDTERMLRHLDVLLA
ncbi:shikimate dehydrogenase [Actinoplanes lutulentus]|uniref:Shikimate dehydrogenase (NADP(+)) n=1 Tax=Actinoplanes lutulentus TaxID=1287878 RepID=A0A327ZL40_9ACTN|nr:shikimate dehydrogenase [Actinoplanes lutulentus]MBB2942526.1 shikimate dehydrogenase [Actinoplanes lutulentus]RAK38107.1 shikimate dehydrogenase [Actinoplanes lutulentus]